MTSDNHRMMVEMSATVVFCTCLFFFNKFTAKIPVASQLENLVFHQKETVIWCPESFVEKFFFFASSTKLSELVVEVQENVQQRSMTYVCKCKRTSSSIA